MSCKKRRWHIKDIIDLEYFLEVAQDSRNRENNIDRNIYLEHIEPAIRENPLIADDRRSMLYCWLENRREVERKDETGISPLPGDIFEEARRLLTLLFLLGGFLSGAGLAFSFLMYRGVHPLNVSTYLGLFVWTQLLLFAGGGVLFALRRKTRLFRGRFLLYTLIETALSKLMTTVVAASSKNMSTEQRQRIQALSGSIKARKKVYGFLFYRPLILVAQVFGIGFNIGVLGATLLRVFTSDLAFGWQSTIQFGPSVVYRIVQIMALPWSWYFSPPVAYPTLEQIEGSRMVLKSGIYSLSTPHLVSWWPFLCLAVMFYGLLPRVVCWLGTLLFQRKALRNLRFDTAVCDQLIMRMQTPCLGMRSSDVAVPKMERSEERDTGYADLSLSPRLSVRAPSERGDPSEIQCVVLLPSDIFSLCDDSSLQQAIYRTYGYRIWEKIKIEMDIMEDKKWIKEVSAMTWPGDQRIRVLLILEAWQPPIKEVLEFLGEMRQHFGMSAVIAILLIGRPRPDTIFTAVDPQDMTVWSRALVSFGDPGLRLEPLGGSHDG
jgi:hypothetical protein